MFVSVANGARAGAGALSRTVSRVCATAQGGRQVASAEGFADVAGAGVLMAGTARSRMAALRGNAGWTATSQAAPAFVHGCAAGASNVGGGAGAAALRARAAPAASVRGLQQSASRGLTGMALAAARRLVVSGASPPAAAGAAPRATLLPPAIAQQTRGMRNKIKGYSSWKGRFQKTANGHFKRQQKGKRHKGFSKTPKQRMQLRASKLVHKSLVQPMKKLNFKAR